MTSVLSSTDFAQFTGVSRETLEQFCLYLDLLTRWNRKINLVGPTTLEDPWRRHVLDSWQASQYLPQSPGNLIDLGSGAGLPGLILAMITEHQIHLIESDKRKSAFLRQVCIELDLSNVQIHAKRIDEVDIKADMITARAFAPLPSLLSHAAKIATPETRYVLHKGEHVQSELTEACAQWTMDAIIHPSQADPLGSILCLTGVKRHDLDRKILSCGGDRQSKGRRR